MAASGFDDDQTRSFTNLAAGAKVSHYKIISKIGAGGMGEVYLALDTKLNRKVALKFLPPHLCQDEDCRRRFTREAQAAAGLDHPNIAAIYEVGEFQGRPFYAMQIVEGQSLREVVAEKDLPIDRILEVAIQICEGLQEAHEKGVIHRDVKPSNILIDSHGRVRLVDFGLAAVAGADQLTKTGSTLGTIGYMSPEQVQGKEVDRRSDLFSLGVVLYEVISGRNPFKRDSDAATLKAVSDDNPEPLTRFKRNVPDKLQMTVDKALDKNKETRYQTAAGMLADLKRVMKDLAPNGFTRVDIRRKRYSRMLIPSLVIVIAILLLTIRPWKFEISPRQEAIAQENKLAIMYFDNLADPTDSLRLGEITTNLLITDLSESEYVQVVSSQRLYDVLKQLGREGEKKIDRDIATKIAQKANAQWMLLGSILNTEPEIILTAQLIDVESGDAIASQRIEGRPGDRIFALVDSLTIEIKRDLSLPAQAMEEEDRPVMEVTTNSTEAYRYYLKGWEYNQMFYMNEAREYYAKALQCDSTLAMAYYRLAYTSGQPQRDSLVAKAVEYSSQASKREQYIIRSYSSYSQERYFEAIETLKRLLDEYPDDKEAYYVLGHIYGYKLNQRHHAIQYYDSVLALDPYYKIAYNALAYLYNEIGEYEKSLYAMNKYIDIAPDEANPYDSRGDIYAYNGSLAKAIESYKKALEIKPEFTQSLTKLGYMHLLNGDYSNAEDCFRELCTSSSINRRSVGRRLLSYIPLYQGRLNDALKMLDDAIAGDRIEQFILGETDNYMLMADIYVEMNECEKAIAEVEKVPDLYLKEHPEDWIYYRHVYIPTLADCGQVEKALKQAEILRKEVEEHDTTAIWRYCYSRGYIELVRGEYDAAVTHFEQAVKDVHYFPAHYLLAISYLKSGELGKAVSGFEDALKRYDVSRTWNCIWAVKVYYYLGMAYEASGWNDKAIKQYETFLDIWKNADEGLRPVEDARRRLSKLKETI